MHHANMHYAWLRRPLGSTKVLQQLLTSSCPEAPSCGSQLLHLIVPLHLQALAHCLIYSEFSLGGSDSLLGLSELSSLHTTSTAKSAQKSTASTSAALVKVWYESRCLFCRLCSQVPCSTVNATFHQGAGALS